MTLRPMARLDVALQQQAFRASTELFTQSAERKRGLARHVPATNIGFAPYQVITRTSHRASLRDVRVITLTSSPPTSALRPTRPR